MCIEVTYCTVFVLHLLQVFVLSINRVAGRYLPVLMQQTKIYWDRDNFVQVEKIFRKSVEFCNDQDTWKLNVAHVLFMQETKYKEAAGFYEPIVKKHYENVKKAMLFLTVLLHKSLMVSSGLFFRITGQFIGLFRFFSVLSVSLFFFNFIVLFLSSFKFRLPSHTMTQSAY